MEETPKPATSAFDSLNPRQQAFVLAYIDCLNASEAYRRAGYEPDAANASASRLLANDSIKAAISELCEQKAMSSGEAVYRMGRWAEGTIAHFMDDEGNLILNAETAIAHRHLIKKYKAKTIRRIDPVSESVIEETNVEIELYDAKDATDKMLQLHGRYKQLPGGGGTENVQEYELPGGLKIRF